MPRTGLGRKPAHHHNNRHENGLVGPGKRIVKQKSNGHLNGSPKGGSQSHTPPLPASSTEQPLTLEDDNHVNGSLAEATQDTEVASGTDGLQKGSSISSSGNAEHCQNGTAFPSSSEGSHHRQPDVNSTKSDATYTVNPMRLASSILKACPVHDTIALLIFLLQLPPAFFTTTQYLFATLTFVPPSVGPMTHLVDPKNSPGAPALTTILGVSAFSILILLALWTPMQNFALDAAQVQVAVALGGGYSGTSSALDSGLVCLVMVSAMHLCQSKDVRQFLAENVLSSWIFDFARPRLPRLISLLGPLSPTPTSTGQRISPDWYRLIPAGHILSQAVLSIVRRWLVNSKNMNQPSPRPGRTGDTEAAVGPNPQAEFTAVEQGNTAATANYGTDSQPISPPRIQENKERLSNTKKRKRQQTLVRSQQPFWAALANAKVTIMREYEISRSAPGVGESKNVDMHEIEEVSAPSNQRQTWISQVQPTSIRLDVSCLPSEQEESSSQALRSKIPFKVGVNGADWASVSIYPKSRSSGSDEDDQFSWIAEIFGLAPSGVYQCSLVRCDNETEFCVLNLKTPAAPVTEQLPSVASPPRELLRPDSPTTTIRNSISVADAKLSDIKARIRRGKKEHSNARTNIRKETSALNERLAGAGGGDDKQRQRVLQMNQDIRRADEATISMESKLEELESVPEEELQQWEANKSTHNTEKQSLLSARDEYASGCLTAKSQLSSSKQELSHAEKSLEKAKKYQGKLKEQRDSIENAKAIGLSEKDRKMNEQNSKEAERLHIQKVFSDQFQALSTGIQDQNNYANSIWNRVAHIQQQQHQAAQAQAQAQAQAHLQQQQLLGLQQSSGPQTPEGNLPGTNLPSSATRSTFNFPFPSLSTPGLADNPYSSSHCHTATQSSLSQPSPRLPFVSPTSLAFSARARERSSSIRSGYSAYTDFSDADPIPPMPGVPDEEVMIGPPRNNSSGSSNSNSAGALPSPGRRASGGGKTSPGMWTK